MKSNIQKEIQLLLKKAEQRINVDDLEEAKGLLRDALEKDSENTEILYNLAVVSMKEENYQEAVTNLLKVINSPLTTVDIIQTKLMLSYAYLCLKKYTLCAPLLISIIKSVPGNITALSLLGFYYEKIGNIDKALETYQNILSFNRENANAHNSFAYLSAQHGKDLNKALSSARICLKKDPDNGAYCDTIGYIYMKMGKMDMAKKYLKAAQQKMPDSVIVREHIHELLKI